MKKIVIYIISILLFVSCSFPRYTFENNTNKIGVSFKEGKWLLNEPDASFDVKDDIKKIVLTKLSKHLPNRLDYIHNVKGILLPKKIDLNPTSTTIQDIKKGTGYDYFINIKSSILKNNLQDIDITNHKFNKNKSKIVEVFLEIYDLNNGNIIYSKKVIGRIQINESNNSDINFTKSTSKLIYGCVEKIIKDLSKKSIK